MTVETYLQEYGIDGNVDIILFESAEGGKIKGLLSKIFRDTKKVDKKEKEESKKYIKEKEQDPKTKKAKYLLRLYSEGKIAKEQLKRGLKQLFGLAIANFITVVFSAVSSVKLLRGPKIKAVGVKIFHLEHFAVLATLLADLAPVILTKLLTKTEKNLREINREIESDEGMNSFQLITSVLSVVTLIAYVIPKLPLVGATIASGSVGAVLSPIIVIASIGMMIVSIAKMLFGLYIGLKMENWGPFKKQANKPLGECIDSLYDNDYSFILEMTRVSKMC